jgi:hypothetical protein
MVKKILLGIALAYVLYIAVGVALLYFGKIERYYFLPGFSIKYKIKKKGVVGTDGPIVYYQGAKALSMSIGGTGKFARISVDTLTDKKLSCVSFQTGERFSVGLKDRLNIEKDDYALPEKMLILSDIEGNFKGLKMILKGTKVIDDQFDWTFGKGHLVLLGDFFDRGTDVTACLWLIYRLEEQAIKAGGKVHFLLGNHEIMNLTGKLHYLNSRYKANADTLGLKYEQWHDKNSELGRWLRTKNIVEKIGDVLYTHAGLSPEVASKYLSITRTNDIARDAIDKKPESFINIDELIMGPNGPFWYRGIAQQEIGQKEIEQLLGQYGLVKMVIGHTILGEIKTLYQGKVIAIDLEHQKNSEEGIMQALFGKGNKFYVINQDGRLSGIGD